MNKNHILRITILFTFLGLISTATRAQNWEFGVLAGASNYHGDLAPEIKLSESKPAAGLFAKYNFNNFFSLRSGFNLAQISGKDENFEANRARNLSFRSNIYEFNSQLEFNFLPFGHYVLTKKLTPYFFTGLNVFKFSPEALYKDEWVKLQPLGTEGQKLPGNKNYSLLQFSVPIGGGVKYELTPNWVLGFELGFRKTFTDYLDDVSTIYPDLTSATLGILGNAMSDRSGELDFGNNKSAAGDMRGDPNLKDWYLISGITLSYRLTPIVCPSLRFWNKPPYEF